MIYKNVNKKGYIALVSVLIMSVVILAILATVSVTTATRINNILYDQRSNNIELLLDSCADEVLLRLNLNNVLPTSVTIEGLNCTVTTITHTGNSWNFDVAMTTTNITRTLNIVAERDEIVEVVSWRLK